MPDEPNLREYFDRVAGENARQAIAQRGDLRLAINAIMTLDGFFGTLHTKLSNSGMVEERSDDAWKESIAKNDISYQVLRDMAYALRVAAQRIPCEAICSPTPKSLARGTVSREVR